MIEERLWFQFFYIVANIYLIFRSQLQNKFNTHENKNKFKVFALLGLLCSEIW